jgi:8-oxo-dGTP pyrophosphatase MutT (NUDIX family)
MCLNDFCIHGVAAIIERDINATKHILIQERQKGSGSSETGLIEIPCGKVRKAESVFDCIRNKVALETGLKITEIYGEKDYVSTKINEYHVLNYIPYFSAQNIEDNYPIVIETFICKTSGNALLESPEAKNIRWISLESLNDLISKNISLFYPMIVMPIKHYLENELNK